MTTAFQVISDVRLSADCGCLLYSEALMDSFGFVSAQDPF
ncbi:hypothetical protein HDG41_005491 [Paraburkholderia sp. JPY162]|uniref:Uncharacterized protein n=1 Tax=Paraburkholderia youngii TaxID=2782701 RepID=A0A7W8LB42_9BURK|nr:hypothetical protein [Paraburkholderia youngii]